MSKKIHQVTLTDQERQELTSYLYKSVHATRILNRARILLLDDAGHVDAAIVAQVGVSRGYLTIGIGRQK